MPKAAWRSATPLCCAARCARCMQQPARRLALRGWLARQAPPRTRAPWQHYRCRGSVQASAQPSRPNGAGQAVAAPVGGCHHVAARRVVRQAHSAQQRKHLGGVTTCCVAVRLRKAEAACAAKRTYRSPAQPWCAKSRAAASGASATAAQRTAARPRARARAAAACRRRRRASAGAHARPHVLRSGCASRPRPVRRARQAALTQTTAPFPTFCALPLHHAGTWWRAALHARCARVARLASARAPLTCPPRRSL